MRYPARPTLSVAAVQVRSMRVLLKATAPRLPGAVGGVESGRVVAVATGE
jgi:hypothetical protein